jgi:hypothetical protein
MRRPDLDVVIPSSNRGVASRATRTWGVGLVALAGLAAGCELLDHREGRCEYQAKAVGVDEQTPLGFSLAQLRESANGTHQSTLTWVNSDPSVLETFPAPQETALTLTGATTGDGRYLEARVEGGRPGERLLCVGRAEIDGEVRVVTADGGFSDAWPVVFQASLGGVPPRVGFLIDLLASPPKVGTFRARWKDLKPSEQQSLQLSGQLGVSGGTSGQVSISRTIKTRDGENGSGTWAAQWGAAPPSR